MNLSVFRDNESLFQINFASEVKDNGGAPLTFYVGRSNDCHVHLDDKQVSREHAKIKFERGQWFVEKVSDFNMISLNGSSCDREQIKNGDSISIGPYILNVEMEDAFDVGEEDASSYDGESEENSIISDLSPLPELSAHPGDDDLTTLLTESDEVDLEEAKTISSSDQLEPEGEIPGEEEGDYSSEEYPEGDFSDEEYSGEDGDYSDDESYGVETYDDEERTQLIQNFASFSLELLGDYAPYDKFVISKEETFIGRDPEKCDIILNDPEVSGTHALVKKNALTCTLEDLKSANGVLLNGERINSHVLKADDEFIIGGTTFTVKIQSDFLTQEQGRMMPVEENQIVEVEEVVEVDENFDGDLEEGALLEEGGGEGFSSPSSSLFSKDSLRDPDKRKKILYILIGLLLLWIFLADDEPKKAKSDPGQKGDKEEVAKEEPISEEEKKLTPEQREFVEGQYLLASQYFNEEKYSETLMELDKIFAITKNYKNARTIHSLAKEGLERITKLLEEERKEKERKLRQLRVKELLKKAEDAIAQKKMDFAKNLFKEIAKLDPENFDVTRLKLEVDAYEKEQERLRVEKAQKEAERKRQIQELAPGKTFYQGKEWYKAILKLQEFLRLKNMDEDLVKEASGMLDESTNNLKGIVDPLLGKARSLKEGQDLKGAYELYLEILKYNPSHEESLNEMDEIRNKLEIRSKKVYREAIISESLSLYDDAREKFQEVQQISPTDSEYYKKATEKLREYLD